ncbi:hypothetical protein BV25DRAFT_1417801 [Artomyces pyxidatus]|uniref:Uncharacterized protein n=1 Tax=Artomyces pyxidatus TaxID=48021 RepID=A0ACB8TE16_9AGAM|nr:hypothetical protein BV25DRAFT_1417801 [Artomyces pyxidatus]
MCVVTLNVPRHVIDTPCHGLAMLYNAPPWLTIGTGPIATFSRYGMYITRPRNPPHTTNRICHLCHRRPHPPRHHPPRHLRCPSSSAVSLLSSAVHLSPSVSCSLSVCLRHCCCACCRLGASRHGCCRSSLCCPSCEGTESSASKSSAGPSRCTREALDDVAGAPNKQRANNARSPHIPHSRERPLIVSFRPTFHLHLRAHGHHSAAFAIPAIRSLRHRADRRGPRSSDHIL